MKIYPKNVVSEFDKLNVDFFNCYRNSKFNSLISIIDYFSVEKELDGEKWQLQKEYFKKNYLDIINDIIKFNNDFMKKNSDVISEYKKKSYSFFDTSLKNQIYDEIQYMKKNKIEYIDDENGFSIPVIRYTDAVIKEKENFYNELVDTQIFENDNGVKYDELYKRLQLICDEINNLVTGDISTSNSDTFKWVDFDPIDNVINDDNFLNQYGIRNIVIGGNISPRFLYNSAYDAQNGNNYLNLNSINSDFLIVSGFYYYKDDGTLVKTTKPNQSLADFIKDNNISEKDISKISFLISNKSSTDHVFSSAFDVINSDSGEEPLERNFSETTYSSVGSYEGVPLQYSEEYNVSDNALTRRKGVVNFNDHKETFYSDKVLNGDTLKKNIPGWHYADDGTIRDVDGYIVVASDLSYLPRGSLVMTSLGPAKVYDTGCDYGTIDIYVNW